MKNRFMAWLMTLVMAVTLLPMSGLSYDALAASGSNGSITLGDAQWIEKDVSYSFPDVTATFAEGQKIFCISVDNGGYFTVPELGQLGNDSTVTGLQLNDSVEEYITASEITAGTTGLTSLTVTSKSSITAIQSFIKGMKFYRNGVDSTEEQQVTVVSNSVELEDNMTAIAIDGKLHYYKYVQWDFTKSTDSTRNWYTAYANAKKSTFNGLKGYLATITSSIEQMYIYKSLDLGGKGAWVGGARTKTQTSSGEAIQFDSDVITELNPGERTVEDIADTWYWMCGPEAERSYYKQDKTTLTLKYGQKTGSSTGCDEQYTYWYNGEPNNTSKDIDPYNQEYCMEYGYDAKGEWNDLWPDDGTVTYGEGGKWKMEGYLIEYSPYTNSTTGDTYAENSDSQSSTDSKIIPTALEEDENPSISANDFIVTKEDAEKSSLNDIKTWAAVSGTDASGNEVADTYITSDTDSLSDVEQGSSKKITFTNTIEEDQPVTTTATAYVVQTVVKDTGTSDSSVEIGASDFTITREQESNRDTDEGKKVIKELAGAVAVKNGIRVSTDEIELVSMVPSDNDGYYDVTFAYDGVRVTVKAEVEIPSIRANDFIVTSDEAKVANADVIKGYAAVQAYTGTQGKPVSVDSKEITVADESGTVTSAITIENGEKFTFTTGTGASAVSDTATGYVVEKTVTSDDKTITIGANNFTITKAQAQAATKNTEEMEDAFKTSAGVLATDSSVGESVIPSSSDAITVEKFVATSQNGVYDVTFQYINASGNTAEVTVQATVEDISADDFIISVDDAQKSDSNDLVDRANAQATNASGEATNIKTTPDDLKDVTEPGIKEITYTTPEEKETTATATIVDETASGEANDKTGETINIGANNFEISVEQAENKDSLDTLFKNLANAVATSDADGVRTSVDRKDISIDSSEIEAENGTYPVTFTYKGVNVTVNATVKTSGIKTPTDQSQVSENITGNDFSVPTGKDNTLTPDTFKEKADVTATKSDGSSVEKTTVDADDLEKLNQAIKDGKKGDYTVTVSTDAGTSTTITVTLTDVADDKTYTDTSDNTQKKDTIAANNFTIGIEDYDKINNNLENVVKLSNAMAYDTETKKTVKITSVDTSKVVNAPGTYPVTLTTENGTSATINVTINSDWKTVGDIDKASVANKTSTTTDTTLNPKAVPNTTTTDPKKDDTSDTKKGNTITPADTTGAEQTFEKTNPKDITEKLDTGRTVSAVSIDGTNLPNTSYTVSGDEITIPKSVFSSYDADTTHTVQITYKDGSKHTFTVKVIDYDEATVIKKVPILKMKKNMGVKTKFTLNLVGIDKTAKKIYKSSKKKVATINSKGVITAKKPGKTVITAYVIQNGSYYKVKVKVTVKKQKIKLYNLKKKALSKKSGDLPEFNVYKRVFKGKKTKLKFTSVEKDAKITYTSSNKKIATVTKKGVIKGKKQGFTVVTARIEQNGKTYVTRIFVRVDDNKKNKNLKKYLK